MLGVGGGVGVDECASGWMVVAVVCVVVVVVCF